MNPTIRATPKIATPTLPAPEGLESSTADVLVAIFHLTRFGGLKAENSLRAKAWCPGRSKFAPGNCFCVERALPCGCRGFVPVVIHMRLCCFSRVVRGMVQMSLRRMGVMGRRFEVAGFVVLGGFAMMPRRVLMMLRCFMVVLRCLLGHGVPL